MFPIAPHFYPICFAQSSPHFTYISRPKGMHPIFRYKFLLWRVFKVSVIFLGDGPIKMIHCPKKKEKKKKKKVELGRHPHPSN
jgi:hypothetical protein